MQADTPHETENDRPPEAMSSIELLSLLDDARKERDVFKAQLEGFMQRNAQLQQALADMTENVFGLVRLLRKVS